MKYKLSICLPAHRTHLWEKFYESIISSVGDKHSWELVMVGPTEPPEFFSDKEHFTFIQDYGSPARCAQIATTVAQGELMMWGSDDGLFTPGSIERCIDLHDTLPKKDVIGIQYTEGRNYQGAPMHPDYWLAHHHPTLRVVPPEYMIFIVGMFKLEYFRELGGWDCRFEHLNMNCHDLAFRVQRDGGKIHLSPDLVCNHDWNPNEGDHIPVQEAYDQNDLELFYQLHSTDQSQRIKINYDNWESTPKVWKRRFGDLSV